MPKKVIINVLIILVGIAATILIARALGGAIYHFVRAGVLTFAVEWLAVFIAGLTGFAPVGTKGSGWSPKKVLGIVAVVCLLVTLFTGGIAGLIGAAVGTVATLLFFRGAL